MGLRAATNEDLAAVMVLENECQLHPWPIEGFQQALRLGQNFKVYEENGAILGYGVADGGHGRTIVAKTLHAAGELYREWFNHARDRGATELYAEIEAGNEAARARLERFGFKMIGERPSFYGPGKPGQVWAKSAGLSGEGGL